MSPLVFLYFESRKRNSNVTVLKNGHSAFIHLILVFIQRIYLESITQCGSRVLVKNILCYPIRMINEGTFFTECQTLPF